MWYDLKIFVHHILSTSKRMLHKYTQIVESDARFKFIEVYLLVARILTFQMFNLDFMFFFLHFTWYVIFFSLSFNMHTLGWQDGMNFHDLGLNLAETEKSMWYCVCVKGAIKKKTHTHSSRFIVRFFLFFLLHVFFLFLFTLHI